MKKITVKKIERLIQKAQKNGEHEVRIRADMLNRETLDYLSPKYQVSEFIWYRNFRKTFFSKPKMGKFEGVLITF